MSIFDGIILAITILLAIKGFFNGFIKEIAGLIGIVGGLFLASKFYHSVGMYINTNLINIPNKSAIDLVGFICVFIGFWILAIFVGFLLGKILKVSALGLFDKILGFIFAGVKFFVLVSIIFTLLYKVEFLKPKIDKLTNKSKIFPIMIKVGEEIINLNPQNIQKNLKNAKISLNNLKGV